MINSDIPGCNTVSAFENQLASFIILTSKKEKMYDHIKRCKKSFFKKQVRYPVMIKTLSKQAGHPWGHKELGHN